MPESPSPGGFVNAVASSGDRTDHPSRTTTELTNNSFGPGGVDKERQEDLVDDAGDAVGMERCAEE